ncbi:sterol carrier family protein [Parasphingorhabdus pacifica]
MPARRHVDPRELRAAIAEVRPWLDDETRRPARSELASAVRLSLRTLERVAPGRSVEMRVPPFAAVQCVSGPEHTRGTPPNVIETDPRTWLLLATGHLSWDEALDDGRIDASGPRADVSRWLPLVAADDG